MKRHEIVDFYLNQPRIDIDRALENLRKRRTAPEDEARSETKTARSAEERDQIEETEKTEGGEEEKIAFWRGFERRKRDAV